MGLISPAEQNQLVQTPACTRSIYYTAWALTEILGEVAKQDTVCRNQAACSTGSLKAIHICNLEAKSQCKLTSRGEGKLKELFHSLSFDNDRDARYESVLQ